VLKTPLRIEDGVAFPFEAPGHGVELDRDALEAYEVDAAALRALDLRAAL
jgi:L-alanine-DL-glutamate epimerase-like enolase superfamily enzyme